MVQDLRHAVRFLLKSKGFALVAASALAVGIGANVTLCGFVSSLALRPMDAVEPERLVRADSGGEELMTFLTYGDYVEYRDRNQSLSELAVFYPGWMAAVRADGPAEMIAVTPVSGNYFATLGVTAALGRAIAPEDDEPGAREIRLRLALGATPSRVVGMTTRLGMLWTGTGIVLGMAGSLVAARLLQSYLNGIRWSDPIPLAAAAFLLAATGYAACLVPARRASRTDPMAALRE